MSQKSYKTIAIESKDPRLGLYKLSSFIKSLEVPLGAWYTTLLYFQVEYK